MSKNKYIIKTVGAYRHFLYVNKLINNFISLTRGLKLNLYNNIFKNSDIEERRKKLIELLSETINFQIKTDKHI